MFLQHDKETVKVGFLFAYHEKMRYGIRKDG